MPRKGFKLSSDVMVKQEETVDSKKMGSVPPTEDWFAAERDRVARESLYTRQPRSTPSVYRRFPENSSSPIPLQPQSSSSEESPPPPGKTLADLSNLFVSHDPKDRQQKIGFDLEQYFGVEQLNPDIVNRLRASRFIMKSSKSKLTASHLNSNMPIGLPALAYRTQTTNYQLLFENGGRVESEEEDYYEDTADDFAIGDFDVEEAPEPSFDVEQNYQSLHGSSKRLSSSPPRSPCLAKKPRFPSDCEEDKSTSTISNNYHHDAALTNETLELPSIPATPARIEIEDLKRKLYSTTSDLISFRREFLDQ